MTDARAVAAVEPHVQLELEIAVDAAVASGQLLAQVSIEPSRRRWTDAERALLRPLFGAGDVLARSEQQSLQWSRAAVVVPAFERRGTFTLELPSGPGLEHAVGKLVSALADGALPIAIGFRGTLFAVDDAGLTALPIPRGAEVDAEIPIEVVRESIARSFGDRRPVAIEGALYERLDRYRLAVGAPSLDAALARLLDGVNAEDA
ncbi:MAG: DUF6084 family protein [Sandaracinaceae bacterium]